MRPAFRPLPPDLRLGQVLCFKHKRSVARDNTVKFQRHTLQLLPDRHRCSYAPVRLSWCCTDWTAGCRYNMMDASLPPRGLAGKPLAGFCTTPSRRITVVYGVIVYAIRFKTPSLHR